MLLFLDYYYITIVMLLLLVRRECDSLSIDQFTLDPQVSLHTKPLPQQVPPHRWVIQVSNILC